MFWLSLPNGMWFGFDPNKSTSNNPSSSSSSSSSSSWILSCSSSASEHRSHTIGFGMSLLSSSFSTTASSGSRSSFFSSFPIPSSFGVRVLVMDVASWYTESVRRGELVERSFGCTNEGGWMIGSLVIRSWRFLGPGSVVGVVGDSWCTSSSSSSS